MKRRSHGLAYALVVATVLILPHVAALKLQSTESSTEGPTNSIVVETEEPKVTLSVEDLKTEAPTTTEVTTPAAPVSSSSTYNVTTSNGAVCILLRVDALLVFKYTTKLGQEEEADKFMPDNALTSGTCNEDDASMVIRWLSYTLTWNFAKTPGGERWYVDKIQLSYNSSEPIFRHINKPGRYIRLSTSRTHTAMLFPTPVGKSYACGTDTSVVVREGQSSGTIILRDLKVQPFIFKKDEFGPEYMCSPGGPGGFRSETAPLAVGTTFGIITLGTVTGYGIYRYFKIKKVEYGTME